MSLRTTTLVNECADLVGALNDASHYAAGVSTVDVDALTTAALYPAGSRFRITGDPTVYTTLINKTTSSNAFTGLTFTPKLFQAALDNAVITFEVMDGINVGDGRTGMLTCMVSGMAGGAVITIEGTLGDSPPTWGAVGVTPWTTVTMATTITADGNYRINATGLYRVRARISTAGTGTTTILWSATEF